MEVFGGEGGGGDWGERGAKLKGGKGEHAKERGRRGEIKCSGSIIMPRFSFQIQHNHYPTFSLPPPSLHPPHPTLLPVPRVFPESDKVIEQILALSFPNI